ncbi:hypothetical protein Glove_346g188 [Diversispora epigaea]|uniref:Cytochrome P450 n=1 Tax=Diversispora epigaea TaxID=1348612 RepID=A0A397HF35_9GLOM|nr:hypothetical protein Glove_346g188 [Diversispora epigaea]
MAITNFLYEILKISLVALTTYIVYYYYKYFTRENPLPGPFPLPFIGNTHQVFKNFSFNTGALQSKYGDLCEFYMGSERFILLSNDDLIQKTLKPIINGPFHNRVKDDNEGLKEVGILNTGTVFNNDYNDWQYHRKFFTKVLMSPSFIKHSVIAINDSFSEMEQYWDKLGEDTVFEFNRWMKRYFFDTIFITTTSKPAYALVNYYNQITPHEKSPVPKGIVTESDLFIESVDAFGNCLVYFFKIPRIVRNFPGVNRFTQYLKDRLSWLRVTVDNIIKSKREEISKTPIDQKLKSDMLTMFLTVNTERDITERIADDLHDKPMSNKDVGANFIEVMSGVNYYNQITPHEKSPVPKGIVTESDLFIESVDAFGNCLVYFFKIPRIVRNFPGVNRFTQYLKDRLSWLRVTVDNIIKSKREEISKTPIDQKLKSDMLTMFLTVNTERDITERIADDLHDKPMSNKDVGANFIEVMSGGVDTSSHSICFLVNYLENNPRVKKRMIEEIEHVLGKDLNSPFKLEDLTKLVYVDAVIKEASRLHPIIPLNFKKNSVPEDIGDYKWSKDTNFVLNYEGIQRDKSYWKDPETFNPDRFIDNPESKNKVLMFGGGLRMCPGRHLAMTGLKATLAMLYRKYDIELLGPCKEHLVQIRSCDELKVKLRKRKNLNM